MVVQHLPKTCLLALAMLAGAPSTTQDIVAPVAISEAPAAAAPHWSKPDLAQLLAAVEAARDEGLRPSDYRRDEIAAAVAADQGGPAVDALAQGAARALAHDYADGRIGDRARFDWHIDHSPAALTTLDVDLDRAVADDKLDAYLGGLLPQDARYAALRDALHATPAKETARIAHIRASMERWRWMPRTLGDDYLMVNVPAYRVTFYRDNAAVVTNDVVVGARKTPTPMISAYVGSIVVNPWWTLPPLVLAEGRRYARARGYVTTIVDGRAMVRQKPGPLNALGRIKIDMPNPYAIYLHDTPAKAAFAKADRALSHGCIRVKDIAALAGRLDETATLDGALAGPMTQTRTLQLQRSVPVYIVYFTAAQDDAGKVVTLADPYARDAGLVAALDAVPRA